MPQQTHETQFAAGLGAAIAAAALVGMAVLPRPPRFGGHFDVLAGLVKLNPNELDAYIRYLNANLTLDSIYLMGHVAMWLGLALVISRRSGLLAGALAVLGVLSGLSDFAENELRLAIVSGLENHLSVGPGFAMTWSVVVGMSIWLIYLAATVTVIGMWRFRPFGWLLATLGALGALTIPFSLQWGWSKAWYVWLIVWHLAASVVLFWASKREKGG